MSVTDGREIATVRALAFACVLLAACEAAAPAVAPEASAAPAVTGELLRGLSDPSAGVDRQIVRRVALEGRREFVPVLVELLRFHERGDVGIPDALRALTGRSFGDDWFAWVEWLGDQDIATPEGFDAWKADLFARIDPNFRLFLYGGVPTRIKLEEIVWGGVRKDGIPALVDPEFIAARDATYLRDGELVFGLEINGDARAYPHRILDWHEMADDVVGGVPLALTY